MTAHQEHLLNDTNPMRQAREKFERSTLPTMLELKAGLPGQIAGITADAQSLKSYAESMKATIKSIGETHFRVFGDHTLTDAAKLVRSAGHAESRLKASKERFWQLAEQAEDTAQRLKAELQGALRPPTTAGEAQIDSELRAWAKQQDAVKLAALVRNDPALRAAIARAPAVLSGVSAEVYQAAQQEHMRATYPDTFEKFEDLKAAIQSANTALTSAEQLAGELIDFQTAKELDSRKVSAIS